MDREKAKLILDTFGRPAFKHKQSNVVLIFARQDTHDIERIEHMTDDEIVSEWKGLVFLNEIYGQVSLNDMQRIALLELEIEIRSIDKEALTQWFDTTLKRYKEKSEKEWEA